MFLISNFDKQIRKNLKDRQHDKANTSVEKCMSGPNFKSNGACFHISHFRDI